MPRRLPIRPPRRARSSFPFHIPQPSKGRALIRKGPSELQVTGQKKPPKIVAMDAVPRIPLSPNLEDHERRLARIEQIKQLYSPKEFKRLRDQQMQLVLPESPLKTTQGRIRLGLLFWIYLSILVSCLHISDSLYTGKKPEGVRWDFWKQWKDWMPSGLLHDPNDEDIDPVTFTLSLDED